MEMHLVLVLNLNGNGLKQFKSLYLGGLYGWVTVRAINAVASVSRMKLNTTNFHKDVFYSIEKLFSKCFSFFPSCLDHLVRTSVNHPKRFRLVSTNQNQHENSPRAVTFA